MDLYKQLSLEEINLLGFFFSSSLHTYSITSMYPKGSPGVFSVPFCIDKHTGF